ncbi:L,D-transpeptidase [Franconibacter sp. IITDAS19]|uniref:L,D-transpeptidase n=1 Tax=Franconibacter sp. IITDAS19 TaxID=2930569 RepID=UPI001FF879CD|nr:L,D-transpeptidase [Franconibacter sp. IITDAS19]MCK1970227.1 L,D-transpeptidase [Franconibacter sp. IITDAS19]
MTRVLLLAVLLMVAAMRAGLAVTWLLPPEGSRLVGNTFSVVVPQGNTEPLESFAATYSQGLSNMLEANPGVDPFLPAAGTTLVIPQQLILPDTKREGIVINVAEMRLYYYPPDTNTVEVLPIGIGQAGRETPRNWVTRVERKQEAPAWVPTANTRREYESRGETLPAMVPPGPENPMGRYAIYIGRLYAIHGTNARFGIGLRVSQGCIRLRDADIKYLFDNVPVGTRVQIIDRPVKFTTEPDGSRWLEVHEPLSRNRGEFESNKRVPLSVQPVLRKAMQEGSVNAAAVTEAMERRSGMPVQIGVDPAGANGL